MLSRRSSVAHSPSLRGATPASKRTLAPAARSGPRRSAAVGTPCRADLCVTLLPLSHHLLRRSIRIYDWRLLGWPGDDECAPQRDERVAGMLACTSVRVKGRGTWQSLQLGHAHGFLPTLCLAPGRRVVVCASAVTIVVCGTSCAVVVVTRTVWRHMVTHASATRPAELSRSGVRIGA